MECIRTWWNASNHDGMHQNTMECIKQIWGRCLPTAWGRDSLLANNYNGGADILCQQRMTLHNMENWAKQTFSKEALRNPIRKSNTQPIVSSQPEPISDFKVHPPCLAPRHSFILKVSRASWWPVVCISHSEFVHLLFCICEFYIWVFPILHSFCCCLLRFRRSNTSCVVSFSHL